MHSELDFRVSCRDIPSNEKKIPIPTVKNGDTNPETKKISNTGIKIPKLEKISNPKD